MASKDTSKYGPICAFSGRDARTGPDHRSGCQLDKIPAAHACERGFTLYPGKLTHVETFRVGCIGAIGEDEIKEAIAAIATVVREMGITRFKPAAKSAPAV
jgi:aspartate aminotransferase-like enzyme